MEKQNINDLINKAKSSNQQKAIQKIVPIVTKEIEEVQFSFYLEKELLKKLKLKALQEDTSMKQIVNDAVKSFLISSVIISSSGSHTPASRYWLMIAGLHSKISGASLVANAVASFVVVYSSYGIARNDT